jgi:uncharacterized membrane protein (DUF485 family)
MDAMAHPGRRLLAGLLALMIVLGSAVLWIGVPVAGFWAAGRVTSNSVDFLLFALGSVPLTMVVTGFLLYRINAVYVSLRDEDAPAARPRSAWLVSSSDERSKARRQRGRRELIDVAMTASAITALVLMFVYFFFIGQMRLAPLP